MVHCECCVLLCDHLGLRLQLVLPVPDLGQEVLKADVCCVYMGVRIPVFMQFLPWVATFPCPALLCENMLLRYEGMPNAYEL